MKKINSIFNAIYLSKATLLAAAVLLLNCKGPEGEIGPKGDTGAQGAAGPQGPSIAQAYENGFIKGTIKGKRRDGSAIEETFEYKITSGQEGFEKKGSTMDALSIYRRQDIISNTNYIDIDILVENKGKANQAARLGFTDIYNNNNSFRMGFQKKLSNNQFFNFYTQALFEQSNAVFPISRTNNATYKLVNFGRDRGYYYDRTLNKSYNVYTDEEGNKIYFEYYYDNTTFNDYYRFAYMINSAGVKSTTSTTFGNLRVDYNSTLGYDVFMTSSTNLYEVVAVPADTYEISDFAYNAATGLVTFNYKVNIEALRQSNSSQNPIEITGSASVTVYDSAVMRKSAE